MTITPHGSSTTTTLHHGDCLDIMRELPDNSVDAIVTDPPYGLGFMGKDWDDLPPGLPWARECLRVLKPGGHLLAFGGTRTWHRLACAVEDAGFEVRDSIAWMHGQGFPKGHASLKPAHEPIVVARKKPDVARGGSLQIDAARVAMSDEDADFIWKTARPNTAGQAHTGDVMNRPAAPTVNVHPAGRWPANVVLDESQAAALDQQSGEARSAGLYAKGSRGFDPETGKRGDAPFGVDGLTSATYDDQGGASRFFYTAKADATERVRINGTAHPTVKPLALMRWLVRLVTPPGGTVLEPFAGSGTTVEACILEGFRCIAIEREADYLPLIMQRINRRVDPVAAVAASGEDGGLFDLLDADTA